MTLTTVSKIRIRRCADKLFPLPVLPKNGTFEPGGLHASASIQMRLYQAYGFRGGHTDLRKNVLLHFMVTNPQASLLCPKYAMAVP